MGNNVSSNATRPAGLTLDSFVAELGTDVVYEKSLGTSRFLKTIQARHKYGRIVVRVFIKPDHSFSLKSHVKRLKAEREVLLDTPNVLSYQRYVETEKAGYLIRQHLANNLYDRISTRPFLSVIEKKWIAFQLLTGLRNAHQRGVPHGDIKSENVIVTSWNWAYLTDFASFKPTFLPEDDPADFSYFFDASGRRTCYLAPERFYAPESDIAKKKAALDAGKRDGKITEAMDVFSLGCVLAELFTEGTPPFTLSQMFKYRSSQYDIGPYLAGIADVQIRNLIESMIQLKPALRASCDQYLQGQRNRAFPEKFYSFLHPLLLNLHENTTLAASTQTPPTSLTGGTSQAARALEPLHAGLESVPPLRTDADEIIEKLWKDFEYISSHFADNEDGIFGDHESSIQSSPFILFPLLLSIPGYKGRLPHGDSSNAPRDDDVALILLSVVCSNIRNCASPTSVSRALDLFLAVSQFLSDETVLDRMLPFVVCLLQDESATIRSQSLFTITQLLLLIHMITPANASIFTEYIIPNIRYLAGDNEDFVRCAFARCIPPLATVSKRFLDMMQAMKAGGTFKVAPVDTDDPAESSYDASLAELHRQVQELVIAVLVDSSSSVKRALLSGVGSLAAFFGRPKTNDVLLSYMLTYLNEDDWMLRAAFFEATIDIALESGPLSIEEYLLPMMLQALADAEDFVSARVISSLAVIMKTAVLSKPRIWDTVGAVMGLLCHPDPWIRQAAARLVSAAATILPSSDTWCILYPALRKLLRCDALSLDVLAILAYIESPLSRSIYEAAIHWASKTQESAFWRISGGRSAPRAPDKPPTPHQRPGSRVDDDEHQLDKLKALGMRSNDTVKLAAMRDHILKIAGSRARSLAIKSPSRDPDLFTTMTVSLQDLRVSLQNILLKTPQDDADRLESRLVSTDSLSHRFLVDVTPRTLSVELTRSPRGDSPAIDDLRRRLGRRPASNASIVSGFQGADLPLPAAKPASTHDLGKLSPARLSQVSLTSSEGGEAGEVDSSAATLRPRDRQKGLIKSKGFEVTKAAPAIAQDSTAVFGTLEHDATGMANLGTPSDLHSALSQRQGPMTTSMRRFTSTYEGNDPNIRYLIERLYLESYPEPQPEFGPSVPPGIPRKRALRSSFPPRGKSTRSPEGNLVGHLIEHTAAIVGFAVSPDFVFFASGSEDGTVKIWDTVRLEKNTTARSRHTYEQGGNITCLAIVSGTHCVASASTNGTLWVHRVDVSLSASLPKYGKSSLIRQHTLEPAGAFVTAMVHYSTSMASCLVYATNEGEVVTMDLRGMRTLERLTCPRRFNTISCLCVDADVRRAWLAAGTLGGYIILWDLRFGLFLRSWRAGNGAVRQIQVHPTRGKGRCIIVAVEADNTPDSSADGGTEVAQVWDLEKECKVETFVVGNKRGDACGAPATRFTATVPVPTTSEKTGLTANEASGSSAAAIAALLQNLEDRKHNIGLRRSSVVQDSGALHPASPTAPSPSTSVRAIVLGREYSTSGPNDGLASSGELVSLPDGPKGGERKSITGLSEGGYLLTGGEDRKIRFWDLGAVERSAVFSGLPLDEEKPVFRFDGSSVPAVHAEDSGTLRPIVGPTAHSTIASTSGGRRPASGSNGPLNASSVKPHRSTVIANQQQALLRNHRDAVTALAVIDLPLLLI